MRDLERTTGVSRETIRFYIREGLLPEPLRTHRNSAFYTAEHVSRLAAIRRLKEERFLPLAVIRDLLAGDTMPAWLDAAVLPGIDRLLAERLGRQGERVDARALAVANGGDPDHLPDLAAAGFIALAADGSVSAQDARILSLLLEGTRLGFTRERGYFGATMARYPGVMRALAEIEVREFFARLSQHVGEAEAAAMAERGIGIITELMAELFTREVLALLADRRRAAALAGSTTP